MLNTPVPELFSFDWWFVTIIGLILIYDLFVGGYICGFHKKGDKLDE